MHIACVFHVTAYVNMLEVTVVVMASQKGEKLSTENSVCRSVLVKKIANRGQQVFVSL